MEEKRACKSEEWGKAFEWKIKGARVDQLWSVTGDFVAIDKWVPSLVQSCKLVEGEPQKPGCVRRPVLYPSAPGEPFTYALERLLAMDELRHRYTYTILAGSTLPGFSLMQDYVSTFQLLPLRRGAHAHHIVDRCSTADDDGDDDEGTLLQWSFVCRPVAALSEQQAQNIAFSLYQTAVNALKVRFSLPDNAVTVLSTPSEGVVVDGPP